jgi:hypothetical protein
MGCCCKKGFIERLRKGSAGQAAPQDRPAGSMAAPPAADTPRAGCGLRRGIGNSGKKPGRPRKGRPLRTGSSGPAGRPRPRGAHRPPVRGQQGGRRTPRSPFEPLPVPAHRVPHASGCTRSPWRREQAPPGPRPAHRPAHRPAPARPSARRPALSPRPSSAARAIWSPWGPGGAGLCRSSCPCRARWPR